MENMGNGRKRFQIDLVINCLGRVNLIAQE